MALLMTSCIDLDFKEPVHTKTDVLYISSACRNNTGVYPRQLFTVSTTPECKDTVMILERIVKDKDLPYIFNVGDTIHLDFN